MKKTLKSLTAIVMVVAICLCAFTACSGADNSAILGTWKLAKAETSGIVIDILGGNAADYEANGQAETFAMLQKVNMEFKADGTAILNGMGTDRDEGKYEKKGDDLYVDGSKLGSFVDNQLVITLNGVTMYFSK